MTDTPPVPQAPFVGLPSETGCDILCSGNRPAPKRRSTMLSREDQDYLERFVASVRPGPYSAALAHRIVVCLNACRNVPSSWLEQIGGGPDGTGVFMGLIGAAFRSWEATKALEALRLEPDAQSAKYNEDGSYTFLPPKKPWTCGWCDTKIAPGEIHTCRPPK